MTIRLVLENFNSGCVSDNIVHRYIAEFVVQRDDLIMLQDKGFLAKEASIEDLPESMLIEVQIIEPFEEKKTIEVDFYSTEVVPLSWNQKEKKLLNKSLIKGSSGFVTFTIDVPSSFITSFDKIGEIELNFPI